MGCSILNYRKNVVLHFKEGRGVKLRIILAHVTEGKLLHLNLTLPTEAYRSYVRYNKKMIECYHRKQQIYLNVVKPMCFPIRAFEVLNELFSHGEYFTIRNDHDHI